MSTLEDRFTSFLKVFPEVEVIDELDMSDFDVSKRRADYFGMNRRLVIEQKTITQDQAEKVQGIIEAYEDQPFYPQFYGTWDLEMVLSKFPNAEGVRTRIYNQVTRLLEGYLRDARSQIASTVSMFGLEESCGLLVILNDKIKILSPEIVVTRIRQRLGEKRKDGRWRFGNIPFVLFISETHLYKGTMPCTFLIEGPLAEKYQHVRQFIDHVVEGWSQVNGGEILHIEEPQSFEDFLERREPLPEKITRAEARRIWYSRNRYMRDMSDDEVLKAAAKYIEETMPYFLVGGPKLPPGELGEKTLIFSDYTLEFSYRGLELRRLSEFTNT